MRPTTRQNRLRCAGSKGCSGCLPPLLGSAALLDRLKVIIDEKFAEMDKTIALKRQRKDNDVAAIFASNRGKALMDEANVFFNGIILAADDRLTARVAEQRSYFAWLRWITIAGGIAIVIVVGLAVTSVARHARELSAAHRDLEALNSGLEDRVRERTADLVRANDEVQRFAYIVTHDLRAPLVNIMGFTSELEAGVASLQTLIEKSGIGSDASDPLVANAKVAAARGPAGGDQLHPLIHPQDGQPYQRHPSAFAGGTQAAPD